MHISIEQMRDLTLEEQEMLLYICNVSFPMFPPMPSETNPYPINLNLIRYANKDSVMERIVKSAELINDSGREIYNGLCSKFGLPLLEIKPPAIEPPKEEPVPEVTTEVKPEVKEEVIPEVKEETKPVEDESKKEEVNIV